MPTPFMHMKVAHQLLGDPKLNSAIRDALSEQPGAYLLGNIAADARVSSGVQRTRTHFFDYTPVIEPPPTEAMLAEFPSLRYTNVTSFSQRAFIAGYLAHLSMDAIWATDMLYTGFGGDWAAQTERFHMLHILLAYLDRRDYLILPSTDSDLLRSAQPDQWLPFLPDVDLVGWRDLIAQQFEPDVGALTLDIFSKRIGWTVQQMDDLICDPGQMHARLFAHVSQPMIAEVEARMYDSARETIHAYFLET